MQMVFVKYFISGTDCTLLAEHHICIFAHEAENRSHQDEKDSAAALRTKPIRDKGSLGAVAKGKACLSTLIGLYQDLTRRMDDGERGT